MTLPWQTNCDRDNYQNISNLRMKFAILLIFLCYLAFSSILKIDDFISFQLNTGDFMVQIEKSNMAAIH